MAAATLLNMLFGEMTPGGVGTGIYSILVMAIIAMFLAGLMVGRTPEYLGKKLGRKEVTAAAVSILAMPTVLLHRRRHRRDPAEHAGRAEQPRLARTVGDPLRLRVGVEQQRSARSPVSR